MHLRRFCKGTHHPSSFFLRTFRKKPVSTHYRTPSHELFSQKKIVLERKKQRLTCSLSVCNSSLNSLKRSSCSFGNKLPPASLCNLSKRTIWSSRNLTIILLDWINFSFLAHRSSSWAIFSNKFLESTYTDWWKSDSYTRWIFKVHTSHTQIMQNSVNNFVNTQTVIHSEQICREQQLIPRSQLHTILQKLYLEAPIWSCRLSIQLSTSDAPLDCLFQLISFQKNPFWMIQHYATTWTKAQ